MTTTFRGIIGKMALVFVGILSAFVTTQRSFAVDILDDPIQIDERVTQLIQSSNSLCWEIYRYHQQKPDYADTYRVAKQFWTQANEIQQAMRPGPMETEVLQRRTVEMDQTFSQLAKTIAKWGPGDQSAIATNSGPTQRQVVAPGVGIEVPFVGIQIGGPNVVVTEDGPPQLERIRLHPNAHGSKRSLERELEAVRVSLNYLAEDAGVAVENPETKTPVTSATRPPAPPLPNPEVVNARSTTSPPVKESRPSPKP